MDILLTENGDLAINEWGDIELTESIRQAIRIRLQWFFKEWRFAPLKGVPYFESILVKNPNHGRIKRIVRREVRGVKGVLDVRNISVSVNSASRLARIAYQAVLSDREFRDEVEILWHIARQNTA